MTTAGCATVLVAACVAIACAGPAPAPPAPSPTGEPVTQGIPRLDIVRALPDLSLPGMTNLVHAAGGNRLYISTREGVVMAVDPDGTGAGAFVYLDISDRVSDRGREEGLLGLAFDPGHADSGLLYVYYSAAGPRRAVLSRFAAPPGGAAADPDSEVVILEIPQPFANHNGGQIAFGPDGMLYVAIGDGGGAGDPLGSGQDRSTLLGSILRIDVSGVSAEAPYRVPPDNPFAAQDGGVRGEIWAYGLRNPWRFSFDPLTGDLWAADVGQDALEEIDLIRPGLNYGWSVMEGRECFSPPQGCDASDLEPPVTQYGRDGGCSVTGGYVYRGTRLPALRGAYVYGDFCSGRVWALRHDGSEVTEGGLVADTDLPISSFGVDGAGELYVLSLDGGVYVLTGRAARAPGP